ncbi:RDD family protein [Promicromonospora kroppenstedtii]|uniref:RDD family protein n=1 Tax=Promicromonospora kroppenstedtii TaxID=440482 RepID=A0ABW7XEZ8_9MICO
MNSEAWRRIAAWLVDWLCFLAWLVVLAAIGIPLYLAGVTTGWSAATTNVVSALLTAVPLTTFLAVLESGPRQATIGKRALGLQVVGARDGGRLTFARALLRNALKVALPWTIGHAAAIGLVGSTTVEPGLIVLTAAAYVLPIAWVVTLFAGAGRTPYDRAGGATVVRARDTAGREKIR